MNTTDTTTEYYMCDLPGSHPGLDISSNGAVIRISSGVTLYARGEHLPPYAVITGAGHIVLENWHGRDLTISRQMSADVAGTGRLSVQDDARVTANWTGHIMCSGFTEVTVTSACRVSAWMSARVRTSVPGTVVDLGGNANLTAIGYPVIADMRDTSCADIHHAAHVTMHDQAHATVHSGLVHLDDQATALLTGGIADATGSAEVVIDGRGGQMVRAAEDAKVIRRAGSGDPAIVLSGNAAVVDLD